MEYDYAEMYIVWMLHAEYGQRERLSGRVLSPVSSLVIILPTSAAESSPLLLIAP